MLTRESHDLSRHTNLISIKQTKIISEYCAQRVIRRASQYIRFLLMIMQHTNVRITIRLL